MILSKNFWSVITMTLCAFSISLGQTTVNVPVTLMTYEYYYNTGIGGYQSMNNTGIIGAIESHDVSGTAISKFRTVVFFDLSAIPAHSTINSVEFAVGFTYTSGQANYTAELVPLYLPLTFANPIPPNPDDDRNGWGQFKHNGTFGGFYYSSTTPLSNTSMRDFVSAAYSNIGSRAFGLVADNEGTGVSDINTEVPVSGIVMKVTYSPQIKVVVRNSFPGAGNVGYVYVDESQLTSPTPTLYWDAGASHTIRAYAQAVGLMKYPFSGIWTNLNTGAQLNQSSDNTSVTIAPTSDCTWQASFNTGIPAIAVTVQNAFGGGNVEVDGVSKSSPWTSGASGQPVWYSGESHTIRSYTQTINAVTYPFTGTWNCSPTGEQRTQGSESTTISISPSSNCTWTASFGTSYKQVVVHQKFSGGSETHDSNYDLKIGHWEGGPDFASYSVPTPPFTITTATNTVTFRGYQDIASNGEKYNHWAEGTTYDGDVTNHHVFQVSSLTTDVTSWLKPTNDGCLIKADLIDYPGSYNGIAQFQDPWLIDYPDPSYNNKTRNRRMSAVWNSMSGSSNNLGTVTTPYKGIFLNESGPPNWTPPYYSVRAPLTSSVFNVNGTVVNGVFSSWGYDGNQAALQQIGSNPSGYDQKAVVFKSAGTTISANYKGIHISSDPAAFANNSQRKVVQTPDFVLHQVYTSMGHVWYETSSNQGSSWTLMNNGQPLDVNGGKCPSIDYNGNAVVIVFQAAAASPYTYNLQLDSYIKASNGI